MTSEDVPYPETLEDGGAMSDPESPDGDDAIRQWVAMLRRLIRATGLSQRKLAQHADITWTHGSIARYASGRVVDDAWELAVRLIEVARERGNDLQVDVRELRRVYMRAAQFYRNKNHTDTAARRTGTRPRPESRPPRQLPSPIPNFVGRVEVIAGLDQILDRSTSTSTTVVIDGEAGIGKTTLAIYWANLIARHYPDGQLFLDLHGFSATENPADPNRALEILLGVCGVVPEQVPHSLGARSALFRSQLAGRRMLILLDNARDSEQVEPLLPGVGSLAIVTSRNQLRSLVVRNNAHRVTLDLLTPPDATSLLQGALGARRTDHEPDAVAEIVEFCARLPLALAIVGERAARTSVPLMELVASLRGEYRRLELFDTRDGRSTSVDVVFSWSYNALSAEARHVFSLLGLHPGPDIGLPAAAALAGRGHTATSTVLDDLVKIHLIAEHQLGRHRFHDLLRGYAAERASSELSADERAGALRRVLTWYLGTARAADQLLSQRPEPLIPSDPQTNDSEPWQRSVRFSTRAEALAWCDIEQANLTSAVRAAATIGDFALAWLLASALWGFFYLRKPWTDWIDVYRVGLGAAQRAGDEFGQAWMHNGLGVAYWSSRRLDEAARHYLEALTHWRRLGNRWGEAMTLNNFGATHNGLGDFRAGIADFNEALRIRREIGDRQGQAQTLANLTEAHRECQQYPDAIQRGHEALEIFQQIDSKPLSRATALHNLGAAHGGLRQFDQALDYYQRSLAIRRDIGDKQGQGETLYHLGLALEATGKHEEAREMLREARDIFDELNDPQAGEVSDRLVSTPLVNPRGTVPAAPRSQDTSAVAESAGGRPTHDEAAADDA